MKRDLLNSMECIILAGGFGTRLGKLTKKTPKPMLPINKIPFIELLIKKITKLDMITKIIISTHYKSQIIKNYFKTKSYPIKIVEEKKPLGTGGAIKFCLTKCKSKKILILNGDTYLNLDFKRFIKKNTKIKKNTMLLVKSKNTSRYGKVYFKKKNIYFNKSRVNRNHSNLINAGLYLLNKSIFSRYKKKIFSFDDFLNEKINYKDWNFQLSKTIFLDIGVKKDYIFAKKNLYQSNKKT